MERIHFMSDLHFEFLAPAEVKNFANAVVAAAETIKPDYLALCGDITTTSYQGTKHDNVAKFLGFLQVVAPHYKGVLHIAGNHEFYHKNRDVGYAKTVFKEQIKPEIKNYHFLDNGLFLTEEYNVIFGTTLWFSYDNPYVYVYQNWMNDFTHIPGGHDFIKKENENAVTHLQHLRRIDLLMTHHGVTTACPPEYEGNPANIYYHTDLTKEILRLQPKYCIHGHTHNVMEYKVGDTIVVTNPYGYNGATEDFDIAKYVDIGEEDE